MLSCGGVIHSCFLAVVFSLFAVVNAPVVPNTVFSISYVSLSSFIYCSVEFIMLNLNMGYSVE